MILYATKLTFERFKLKMPSELHPPMNAITEAVIEKEQGTGLLEWGAKIFYFDRRKSIQFVNFASKFTIFVIDLKLDDLPQIGNIIAHYLFKLYEDDKVMCECLEKLFDENPFVCFTKLTDKSIITTLNHTQLYFADDGYRFFDYIDNGILHTVDINRDVNFDYPFFVKINGKRECILPGEYFRELVLEHFGIKLS